MNQLSKRALLWIHNPFCFVCGYMIESFSESSIEHIVPRSRGGTDDPHNLAVSHQGCNRIKSNSLNREEWIRKIDYFNSFGSAFVFKLHVTKFCLTDSGQLKVIKDAFHDFEFVQLNIRIVPRYYEDFGPSEIIEKVKKPVKKLKKLKLDALISISKYLDEPGSKNYWRLIFGILFIELYQIDFDREALLHAIWRIDTYKKNINGSLIFWEFSNLLLDICKECDPEVYEKYESLQILKSQLPRTAYLVNRDLNFKKCESGLRTGSRTCVNSFLSETT